MVRRWWPVAATAATILLVLATWVLGIPRFGAPDEPAHMYKAYGVAHGELLGTPATGFDTANLREFHGPQELGPWNLNCFVGQPEVPFSCTIPEPSPLISSAGPYPPYYYGVVGGAARLSGEADSIRFFRMISAVLCAAALTAALAIASRSRVPRLAPLLLVAVTPTAWFLMGSINPNALEIACFAVLWALLARLSTDDAPSRWHAPAAGVLAGAVVLMRPVALAWLVPVAICVLVAASPDRRRRLVARRSASWLAAPTVVAGIGSILWLRYASFNMNDARTDLQTSFGETLRHTVESYGNYLHQAAGQLGWADTSLPAVAYVAMAVAAAGMLVVAYRHASRREVVALALLVGAWLTLPIALDAFTGPTAGPSWQGRYSLPLIVGLPFLATASRRATRSDRLERIAVPAAVALASVVEVVAFWQLLRRYAVGIDGTWWLTGDLAWQPPVQPMALVALNAVGASAMAFVVLRTCRQIERGAGERDAGGAEHGHRTGVEIG